MGTHMELQEKENETFHVNTGKLTWCREVERERCATSWMQMKKPGYECQKPFSYICKLVIDLFISIVIQQ